MANIQLMPEHDNTYMTHFGLNIKNRTLTGVLLGVGFNWHR